jgi:transposase-like protein
MSGNRESELSIVEPTHASSPESAQEAQASAAKPDGSRRRRLSLDEKREIARLYAETGTPTSEIRERFGIGDSSLYRVVQRRGVALRGRTASSTQPNPPPAHAPAAQRPRSSTASGAHPAVSLPATTSPAERSASQTGGGARHRFRIRFEGERVFEAKDIQDALRQAESFGATEITAVARQD